jgi:hypothetical protein
MIEFLMKKISVLLITSQEEERQTRRQWRGGSTSITNTILGVDDSRCHTVARRRASVVIESFNDEKFTCIWNSV